MSTALISFVATFFALMGVVALVQPARILRTFGIEVSNPEGRNEVRAVYGGFGVALAALLIATFYIPALRSGVALTVAVALLGMAAGRVVSAALDGQYGRMPLVFTAVEIGLAVMLLLAAT